MMEVHLDLHIVLSTKKCRSCSSSEGSECGFNSTIPLVLSGYWRNLPVSVRNITIKTLDKTFRLYLQKDIHWKDAVNVKISN
jgi:hypothetical protein